MECFRKLPKDWQIEIHYFNDEYPCVSVKIIKDFGRIYHYGYAYDPKLEVAISLAIDDLLLNMEKNS